MLERPLDRAGLVHYFGEQCVSGTGAPEKATPLRNVLYVDDLVFPVVIAPANFFRRVKLLAMAIAVHTFGDFKLRLNVAAGRSQRSD